jgi:nucleoside-diphosphate-sugar epimerase
VDISDRESCRALLAAHPGVDCVVHAAALAHVRPGAAAARACDAVNVAGTRHVVDAAIEAGVKRFVFISSVTVYGDFDLPLTVVEDTPPRPVSLYGAAKQRGEAIVRGAAELSQCWILRMSTMYAPDWLFNVRKRVVPPIVGRFVHFTLNADARRYTLCSRRNGAEAVAWAVDGRLRPGTFNVAETHVYSQREILDAVERVEGPAAHLPLPAAPLRLAAQFGRFLPSASIRHNAQSRYWKFCEHNVYSAARLAAAGLTLAPDLLAIGSGA